MKEVMLNLAVSSVLLAGAFILANPTTVQAQDCEVRCYQSCWVSASGSSGCGPILCECI